MSDAPCPHECDCDCHRQVTKKHVSDTGAEALFEMPQIVHVVPCCDGQCPQLGCRKFIKQDMMSQHLIGCHQMSESNVEALINPQTC